MIQRYGYPFSLELFAPHISLGRFAPDVLDEPGMKNILGVFNPTGRYTSGHIALWQLPPLAEDPTETPKLLGMIYLDT